MINSIVFVSQIPLKKVSLHFNSIDFAFCNYYQHKCQYGGNILGKKEKGIIEPIQNKGQHERINEIGFEASTSSTPLPFIN